MSFVAHLSCRLAFVTMVAERTKGGEYIKNQLTEDQVADQIGLKEFVDPFTGRENKKA